VRRALSWDGRLEKSVPQGPGAAQEADQLTVDDDALVATGSEPTHLDRRAPVADDGAGQVDDDAQPLRVLRQLVHGLDESGAPEGGERADDDDMGNAGVRRDLQLKRLERRPADDHAPIVGEDPGSTLNLGCEAAHSLTCCESQGLALQRLHDLP
jgi:hypothetical protein